MRFLFNEGKTHGVPEKVWEDWIRQVDKNYDGGVKFPKYYYLFLLDQFG